MVWRIWNFLHTDKKLIKIRVCVMAVQHQFSFPGLNSVGNICWTSSSANSQIFGNLLSLGTLFNLFLHAELSDCLSLLKHISTLTWEKRGTTNDCTLDLMQYLNTILLRAAKYLHHWFIWQTWRWESRKVKQAICRRPYKDLCFPQQPDIILCMFTCTCTLLIMFLQWH